MKHPITLEALEVLDAIERKGSFAGAANALYRVPSAISYSVQKLEDDLGVKLFRREGRRSLLTPAGSLLLEQGRELLIAAENLAESTRQVDSGWESTLNIAIDSILEFEPYYKLINDFYQVKPDIEINLYEEVLGGTWEAVLDGRVDLALGAGEPPSSTQGCQTIEMQRIQWVFAIAPDHELTRQTLPLNKQAIENYRSVIVRDSSRTTAPLSSRLFSKQPVFTVPTLQEKIRAQTLGLGVGFLPRHRILRLLADRKLVELPTERGTDEAPVHMIWKTNNKGRALSWFIDALS
jgi:DNA-binding transcriptional LysR family regulator